MPYGRDLRKHLSGLQMSEQSGSLINSKGKTIDLDVSVLAVTSLATNITNTTPTMAFQLEELFCTSFSTRTSSTLIRISWAGFASKNFLHPHKKS